MKRNKASYVGGAAALLVSSVTVKILGALFKIPLTNLIGDSGMGLFAFAMQFFSLLFVISAAGIPAAEAHLVSEALAFGRRQQAKAIAVRAGNVFAVTSALLSLALAGAAPTVCRAFGQTDAVPCLLTIAPAVFLVTRLFCAAGIKVQAIWFRLLSRRLQRQRASWPLVWLRQGICCAQAMV